MKWSYRIGRWFGIGVEVHLTFLLLLAYVAFQGYGSGGVPAALGGVLFVSALFFFVVLHEYGHALTAARFGIRTRRITLYPIGGMAMLEGMPRSPRAQLLIALAGPAVNFVLAAVIALVMLGFGVPFGFPLSGQPAGLLSTLLYVNLVMGAFNLLPALPMDGGRVLRAFLEMRIGALRATEIAARVARVVAVGMGLFGLFVGNPILVAIAVMVWFMAGVERRQAAHAEALRARGIPDPYSLMGSAPGGPVPRARPPSSHGPASQARPRVVVEVVEGPDGPRVRFVRP